MVKLFNTMGRKKQLLKPMIDNEIRMYTCGPTVYDYAHIGNLRAYLCWDLLKRVLESDGYSVKHVMNFTDVGHLVSDDDSGQDKMEKGAERERKSAWEIADFYIGAFKNDIKKLRIHEPTINPRATDHISEMIDMIKILEKKGFTYLIEDGVYFDSAKLSDYGKLANLDIEGLKAGARVEMAEGKKNITDFALWKFSPKGSKRDMEWDSPWGKGFPGWHIECSVMARKYLGDTLDIHCGGIDHIPVHHTNEIAQSEAATGKKFSRFWVHNEFMSVEGKKMSKSIGNFYTLKDIEEKGFSPIAFRYLCLSSHYRSQMSFSFEALKDSQNAVDNLNDFVQRLKSTMHSNEENPRISKALEKAKKNFLKSLDDDLNTPNALSAVFGLMKYVNKEIESDKADKKSIEELAKFFDEFNKIFDVLEESGEITAEEQKLIDQREHFRKEKNFIEADKIRDELKQCGLSLEDSHQGPRWKRQK